jgi:hypothetical protein
MEQNQIDIDKMITKINNHIELTNDCIENFNLEKSTIELLRQDNLLLEECKQALSIYKGDWINNEDVKRMALELDIAMNGEHAAKSPSLCDVISQAETHFNQEPVAYMIERIVFDGMNCFPEQPLFSKTKHEFDPKKFKITPLIPKP